MPILPNPYPGPRSFTNTPEDIKRFFGRQREKRDIVALIGAQQVLLIYGKSGTGKSSLLNAAIIPTLEDQNFTVMPVARVQGLSEDVTTKDGNIYMYNILTSWEASAGQHRLAEYLDTYFSEQRADEAQEEQLRVIFFDQFEELFTAYKQQWAKRKDFFEQVKEAVLADPLLRVVFIMREDYIAELDKYAKIMPGSLRSRFRLEPLNKDQAIQAIVGPLKDTDRTIVDSARDLLVGELLRLGGKATQSGVDGEYVEPVILQVVSRNMWTALPDECLEIGLDEVEKYAQVDNALEAYYEDCVKDVSDELHIKQQDVRKWFEEHLITADHTRGAVHHGKTLTGFLRNETVERLSKKHIIRREQRAGAIWYELIHDRFIEPILKSNKRWQAEQLEQERQHIHSINSQLTQAKRRYEEITSTEQSLWEAADQLRANSQLRASQYSAPVLGLIFLKFADFKMADAEQKLQGRGSHRRSIDKSDYQAMGVMYVPPEARYDRLLQLTEGDNIGRAITNAMKAIEDENEDLRDVLPKTYNRFENSILIQLLRTFNQISMDGEEDTFGRIYEYFLNNFARSEGQRGGEFFTPTSLVKLIVQIIEPYEGRIYDPACGSGGMFVQSAQFVEAHRQNGGNAQQHISIYGQERVIETVRLAKMNLAVHGLSGDIRTGNSYYDLIPGAPRHFDYVMANPPFNVNGVDKSSLKDDTRRFPFGLPTVDNANYIWIQLFYSTLNERGRAGFIMANSASDARHSEATIRQKLIESGVVDVMVAIGPNFFYTVTLPCTLWFFDKGKTQTERRNTILFIDARDIFIQVDRAHRDFTLGQIEFLANIVRLYRGELPEYNTPEGQKLTETAFPNNMYADILGRCKVASIEEIGAQGWSLNPGRYVGVAVQDELDDFDFTRRLEEIFEILEQLNAEAHDLETQISENIRRLLNGI